MRLVVDANVLFSAFLKDGVTRRLWLDRRLEFFAPVFLLEEFQKHFPMLVRKSGLPRQEAVRLSKILVSRITFAGQMELAPYKAASKFLVSDEKDEPYVACALSVGADLWSRDRHVRKGRVKCWSTDELFEEYFEA